MGSVLVSCDSVTADDVEIIEEGKKLGGTSFQKQKIAMGIKRRKMACRLILNIEIRVG